MVRMVLIVEITNRVTHKFMKKDTNIQNKPKMVEQELQLIKRLELSLMDKVKQHLKLKIKLKHTHLQQKLIIQQLLIKQDKLLDKVV